MADRQYFKISEGSHTSNVISLIEMLRHSHTGTISFFLIAVKSATVIWLLCILAQLSFVLNAVYDIRLWLVLWANLDKTDHYTASACLCQPAQRAEVIFIYLFIFYNNHGKHITWWPFTKILLCSFERTPTLIIKARLWRWLAMIFDWKEVSNQVSWLFITYWNEMQACI